MARHEAERKGLKVWINRGRCESTINLLLTDLDLLSCTGLYPSASQPKVELITFHYEPTVYSEPTQSCNETLRCCKYPETTPAFGPSKCRLAPILKSHDDQISAQRQENRAAGCGGGLEKLVVIVGVWQQ